MTTPSSSRSLLLLVSLLLSVLLLLSILSLTSAQAAPSISAIFGCPVQSNASTSGCNLANTLVLSIVGDNFNPSSPSSMIVNVSGTTCSTTAATSTSITCVFTGGDRPFPIDTPVGVSVVDTRTLLSSPTVYLVSFTAYKPITLTSISGCVDVGSTTTRCKTTTDVLTVKGSGFAPSPYPTWTIPSTGVAGIVSRPATLQYVDSSTYLFPLINLTYTYNPQLLPNSGQLGIALQLSTQITPTPLIISFIPTPQNSGPSSISVLPTNITITGVSGCTDVANITTLCTKPAMLTITGSGFPTQGGLVTFGTERCTLISAAATRVVCQVTNVWSATPLDTLLPVVVSSMYSGSQSNAFLGVSFTLQRIPSLTSISGCQGSGLTTVNCDVNSATLTLLGSGFSSQPLYSWQLLLSNNVRVYPSGGGGQIVDDGTLLVPMASLLTNYVSQLKSLNGSSIFLALTNGLLLSNALSFSMLTPTANITGFFALPGQAQGCMQTGPFTLVDCSPGVSVVYLQGQYLFTPLTVTVADVPCIDPLISTSYIQCTLPSPEGFTPGTAYDIVLTQGLSTVITLPGAISFTARPTIASITSQYCPRDFNSQYYAYSMYCAAGDVITVVGAFFSPSESLSVQLSAQTGNFFGGVAATVNCTQVQLLSSSALSCVLPTLDATQAVQLSGYIQVQVFENATSYSNQVQVAMFRAASQPAVLSVSGCAGSDANTRGVTGCITGSWITVHGANFMGPTVVVEIYELEVQELYICQSPQLLSTTAVMCQLPYIARLEEEVVLPIRVRVPSGVSNWLLAVGYAHGIAPPSVCTQQESYRSAFIVCAVLLAVVSFAMAVLVGALCFYRSKAGLLKPGASAFAASEREESTTWKAQGRGAVEMS